MSGICDKCKRKPCPAEGEGLRYCDFYDGGESNYEKLFGTPERAARTLMEFSPLACSYCALYSACGDDMDKGCLLCDYDALLEWLRGDAE